MAVNVGPPTAQAANQSALTKGQVTAIGPLDLTTVDPTGANVNSYVSVNTMFNAAHTGAQFTAVLLGNGHRLQFQVRPFGGSGWKPAAAMDTGSGIWDYEHRTYDSGGLYSWLVPTSGHVDVRMVRMAGPAGSNTCLASAIASHNAMPFPPPYVGKRDVSLIVDDATIAATPTFALVAMSGIQENDDRTRTPIFATTYTVPTGRRLMLHSFDITYNPGATGDRARVRLLSRKDGVVGLTAATDVVFLWVLNSAAGRAGVWDHPREFQQYLGAGQMNVGLSAVASTATPGKLGLTLSGFTCL